MISKSYLTGFLNRFLYLFKTIFIIIVVSVVTGSLVTFFLYLLDFVTHLRWANPRIVYLLPPAGMLIVWLYNSYGKGTDAGNNLVIGEINGNISREIPLRMLPFVLFTTILTHLFGGSAGREGTAVQIGGSFAAYLSKIIEFGDIDRKLLLTTGISAGFGAVFGTPVAGAIFALEVLSIGRIRYEGLLYCLLASILADFVSKSFGITHTHYHINSYEEIKSLKIDFLLLFKVILSSIIFGFVAAFFVKTSDIIKNLSSKFVKQKLLPPFIGGVLVILISYLLGTEAYLGLGVEAPNTNITSITSAFKQDGAETFAWFWKLLLTAITLSTGFKGGEVTPLFFIGATLGNSLAVLMGCPVDLLAGLGFIAVFSAATNTPLASIILGIELFGTGNILYYAVSCIVAYYFSGNKGIYNSQYLEVSKRL